jgi:Ser/Thr protein kinase RdoA (MazF antagonist)
MTDMQLGLLPYNGTSGWSGTDTSEQRAELNDNSGITGRNQRIALKFLSLEGEHGLTWVELAAITQWHHGASSGVLSVLHKEGKISRLLEKRTRCRVYVLNEYVSGRETDSQGRKPKECPNCGHSL